MTVDVYVPTGEPVEMTGSLAARPPTLGGMRVGLLHNGKAPGQALLEEARRRLLAAGAVAGGTYLKRKSGAGADPERLAELAGSCDAVVNALAD